MGIKEILVFLILFGANLLQAITGFAGTLISMPPTMKLIGVDEAKALLNAIAQISSLMIVITGFRHINWKEFFKMFVLMAAGMVVGMKIFEVFPMQQLLTFYGIMIIVIALDKLFVKKQLGAFFILFWWNGGCLAMILLAEIRLHERIIWIG